MFEGGLSLSYLAHRNIIHNNPPKVNKLLYF